MFAFARTETKKTYRFSSINVNVFFILVLNFVAVVSAEYIASHTISTKKKTKYKAKKLFVK